MRICNLRLCKEDSDPSVVELDGEVPKTLHRGDCVKPIPLAGYRGARFTLLPVLRAGEGLCLRCMDSEVEAEAGENDI